MDRLRELLGVPPGKYERVDNLMRKVIEPAVLQVNKLSDMSVAIKSRRRHSRAPVHEFDLTWWRKQGDELREAIRERKPPQVRAHGAAAWTCRATRDGQSGTRQCRGRRETGTDAVRGAKLVAE